MRDYLDEWHLRDARGTMKGLNIPLAHRLGGAHPTNSRPRRK
jgi:hypothetical protein